MNEIQDFLQEGHCKNSHEAWQKKNISLDVFFVPFVSVPQIPDWTICIFLQDFVVSKNFPDEKL